MGDCGSWYKSAMARMRAANPAAELARPAAVGKLLLLTRRRWRGESAGRDGSEASRSARRARRERRQASERGVSSDWGVLFRRSESVEKRGEQAAVVWVRRSDCERVTEREELVGRLRLGSRFPQYLV